MTKEEFLYELKKELSALDSAEAMAYNFVIIAIILMQR